MYQLGVDLGGTWSAAAVCRSGRAEVVPLAPPATHLATVAYLAVDGSLLVGEQAERHALTEPVRFARRFTHRIGDGTPLRLGADQVAAETLTARFLARVVDTVAQRERAPATRIAVAHPAGWGAHRLTSLRRALAGHGLGEVLFVSDAQAVAVAHTGRERGAPGDAIAVYDLGGSTFTATVLRRLGDDRLTLAGRPEEVDLGGLDFDEAVFNHVRTALGTRWDELDPADTQVLAAVAELRRACTGAKEALSADTEVRIPVTVPGTTTQVRIGRAEFEDLIAPAVEETVAALHRAIDSAGVEPDRLAEVILTGGSARIPLVTQLVSAQFGRAVFVPADPQGIAAVGAALAATGHDVEHRWAAPAPLPSPPTATDLPQWTHPPIPVFAPQPADPDTGRWRKLAATVVPAVAATVLALIILIGALAGPDTRPGVPGADADTATSTPVNADAGIEGPDDEPTVVSIPPSEPPATREQPAPRPRPRDTAPAPVTSITPPSGTTPPAESTTVPTTSTPPEPQAPTTADTPAARTTQAGA